MSKKLTELFQNISEKSPDEKLADLILAKIEKMQKRKLWLEAVSSFSGVFLSISMAIYIFLFFGKSLLDSQFWGILSLAFSDVSVVVTHSQEFFYSLLETLPAMTFAVMLIPIFTLLVSLYSTVEIFDKFNKHKYYF